MQSVILTLDGAITVGGSVMRWVPPERADEIRAERRRREDEYRKAYDQAAQESFDSEAALRGLALGGEVAARLNAPST